MILTGEQIKKEIAHGNIGVDNFREESIQPNSYDFHLGDEIIRYKKGILNYGSNSLVGEKIKIPKKGFIIRPREFYLGITQEVTSSKKYTQLLFGDNSLGSLGVWVQVSAPMAHVGSKIRWTLEIRCTKPTVVYPGMKFGKICFLVNEGLIKHYGDPIFADSGRYLKNKITTSQINLKVRLN